MMAPRSSPPMTLPLSGMAGPNKRDNQRRQELAAVREAVAFLFAPETKQEARQGEDRRAESLKTLAVG